jgi:hypothetical protein
MIDDDMSAAWREAGRRLGVRVIAPHVLRLPDRKTVDVEAFLPDFGGPLGAVVVSLADEPRCRRARASDSFVSQLAVSYRTFDEELFRETLDDWGWFGPVDRHPAWYTGKPWS